MFPTLKAVLAEREASRTPGRHSLSVNPGARRRPRCAVLARRPPAVPTFLAAGCLLVCLLHVDAQVAPAVGTAATEEAQTPVAATPTAAAAPTATDAADIDVRSLWNYELVRIGPRPVRISQLILALLITVVGLWVSHFITRAMQRRLDRYGRFSPNATSALQKLIQYTLAVMIVLIALQVMAIPVGVFAFLGGAIAIGVGFGAQNLFNNFLSGLILTFERPIRIGDFVEVSGHIGRVEKIGGRCTRVKRTDGIDILVPNSTLLENDVINWTLTDRRVRTLVKVGVVYGSPTDAVARLILQAVNENASVLKKLPVTLVFEDFGDNALQFEVYFWTEVGSAMELRQIRSMIRFRIDALFREAGIVIAFPQRDVHLDAARPLDVRVVAEEPPGDGNDPAAPV